MSHSFSMGARMGDRAFSRRSESTANVAIAATTPLMHTKIPAKASSFNAKRGHSDTLPLTDSPPVLPGRGPDTTPAMSPSKASKFRAAETGKGDLLPTSVTPRARAATSSGVSARWTSSRRRATADRVQNPSILRSRRRSIQVESDHTSALDTINVQHTRHVMDGWDDCKPATKIHYRRDISIPKLVLTMRPGTFIQVFVVMIVTYLVFDAYRQAVLATGKLEQYKSEESLMMLHLHRIEEHSIHLHENLSRLSEGTLESPDGARHTAGSSESVGVDSELLHRQTQQLRQMEEELSHEVKALQSNIKQSSRASIVRTYGEGPVQVLLDLDFGDQRDDIGGSRIAILLWYDTPYSSWTWLQQIRSGLWNGSIFQLDKGGWINAQPPASGAAVSKLEFMEKSSKTHEAWTVGLSENADGGFGMFINLKDNSEEHKNDACVGKVIDGFDALQRLVDVSRSYTDRKFTVKIKEATASHLTRAQTSGLI